jgi:hypothetical protein
MNFIDLEVLKNLDNYFLSKTGQFGKRACSGSNTEKIIKQSYELLA